MKIGDEVLYYHSMTRDAAVVGLAKVSKTAFTDTTAEEGDWSAVELTFKKKFSQPVSLQQIKATKSLQEMKLLKIGRLSVSPVTDKEFETIMKLAGEA